MLLVLFRHGPAGDSTAWSKAGKDDSARPLTPKGREKTRAAAEGLARVVKKLDQIVTSPLARARQTADILAKAYPRAPKRQESGSLAPSSEPGAAARWVSSLKERAVAVVGHEPHLSLLATLLLKGRAPRLLALKKAGAAVIDLKAKRLVALYPPKVLRRLGR